MFSSYFHLYLKPFLLQLSLVGFPPSSIYHFNNLPISSRLCKVINYANDDESPREEQITVERLLLHCNSKGAVHPEVLGCHHHVNRDWFQVCV